MGDIDAFAAALDARVRAAASARQARARTAEDDMAARERSRSSFEAKARPLYDALLRPRLEQLLAHFPNCALEHAVAGTGVSSVCRFAHTERFPATVTLVLGLVPSDTADDAVLTYRAEVLPILMPYRSDDHRRVSLSPPARDAIAGWVDERLLEFVDMYLELATNPQYQRWSSHADPVCGMRVVAGETDFTCTHEGTRYFFCSASCHARFVATPEAFGAGAAGGAS